MRYCLGIEYQGDQYSGWQRQANREKTLQAVIETALSKVAGDVPVAIMCSGRTDRGVHATQQFIHFDTEVERLDKAWVLGTNDYLPDDIRVLWCKAVPDDFNARHSAKSRSYRYIIYQAPIHSARLKTLTSWIRYSLDTNKMSEACKYLLGEHDFSSFRASGCQARTPVRTMKAIKVSHRGSFIFVDFKANAFLYHMIRNIMGVLIEIGRGKQSPDWMKEVLAAKERSAAANTAPAEGLYFLGADYDECYGLPKATEPNSLIY